MGRQNGFFMYDTKCRKALIKGDYDKKRPCEHTLVEISVWESVDFFTMTKKSIISVKFYIISFCVCQGRISVH